MEMAYMQAENLKHKRTFVKKLMVLAPLVTMLINFFAPLWFQMNSYNWWYVMLYPGFLTLLCTLIEQRDNGKLKYRGVASLPVSQNKVWKAKIGIACIYSWVGNIIFLLLNLLGGFVISVINGIPLVIGIWQAVAGTVCIVIGSLWEIPLCLWLSKKVGIFITVLLNAGLGSMLGIFAATTSLWVFCPYSWVSHLMISVLNILPNGQPVVDHSTAMPFWRIILVLFLSLVWFAVLSFVTERGFEKQEVG